MTLIQRSVTMRTAPKKMAKTLAKHLRDERPDYDYLKAVFKELRNELNVEVPRQGKKLPLVPTSDQLLKFYETVWNSKNFPEMVMVRLFLYTGVRVSELINIKINDVDFNLFRIRINNGKGGKDRYVPFPKSFKELLAVHVNTMQSMSAIYLFESNRKTKYTDRGIRKIIEKHSQNADTGFNFSPHKFRHYFLTWLKLNNIDDALIQPYSGHESRKSLEVYSRLSISEAQTEYNKHINQYII